MAPRPATGKKGHYNQDPQAQLAREVARRLTTWFHAEGRRFPWREGGGDRWKLLLTEMLLQQTQAARVASFVGDFFQRYSTLDSIAREDEVRLALVLAPLGLQTAGLVA